jgi:hypothetical protein
MTDRLDFETQLGERLRSRAAMASRPFDAAMIARQAVAVDRRRRRIGPLGRRGAMIGALPRSGNMRGGRRNVGLLAAAALIAALLVGGAIAIGSGLVRLSPIVPPAIDATVITRPPSPSTSPSVSPSPTPGLTPSAIGSGSWSVTDAPRHAGCCATATLLRDGRVLLASVAAADGNTATTEAQLYDPATGEWTKTGRMHTARWGSVASLLADGRVLVGGGVDPAKGYLGPLASAELYDPASGQWTETGSMATWRWGSPDNFKAVSLADGRVLVLGGQITGQPPGSSSPRIPPGGGGETKGAETYDPESGTWSWARPMAAPPTTATVLPDGRVLVTHDGGSSELFDPRTGRWTAAASTTQPVSSARATLLANGDVLLVGTSGRLLDGCPCTDGPAELYDADTDSWTPTGSVPARSGTVPLLADGIALVFGPDGALRYDPQSGSWATVEAPPPTFLSSPPDWPGAAPTYWPLSAGIAIRLLDGRVLAVGEAGGGKARAALFDPTGNP